MCFTDLDEAVKTAERAAEMMKSREKLEQMIEVACVNGFED